MFAGVVQTKYLVLGIWGNECHRPLHWVVWQIATLIILIGQLPTCVAATPATACANSGGMIQFEDLGQPPPEEASQGRVFRMDDGGTDHRSASVFQNTRQPEITTPLHASEMVDQQDQPASVASPDTFLVRLKSFTPYVKLYSFDWQEHLQSAKLLEESGVLFAAGYRIESPRPNDLLFGKFRPRFLAEVFGGGVAYDGHTQIGEPVSATTNYLGVRLDLTLLAPFDAENRNNLFFALGCQVWNRELPGFHGYSGYSEGWFTFYPRFGYEARRLVNDKCEFFADVSLGLTAYTREFIGPSTAFGNSSEINLFPKPNPTFGLELGLRGRRMFVCADLAVMTWRQSNVVGELEVGQPDSQMVTFGLSAGLVF